MMRYLTILSLVLATNAFAASVPYTYKADEQALKAVTGKDSVKKMQKRTNEYIEKKMKERQSKQENKN